ncbi:hypothetical protein B0H10DRAFT_2211356 [Mycena sp. CBHHK59/15]|nr:hypothetical protein B0H10DRAFT_2211356 [Mycena sp. CBHHK59/15]
MHSAVRDGLRSGARPFNTSYYARLFYEGFEGNPGDVEAGFLKSRYLVKGYKACFTAPSSVDKDDDENTPPSKKVRGGRTIRKAVADILRMSGKVTPRSIGYVAILEHFSLTNASQWTPVYYGLSYPQMYNFIVDFFEAPKAGTKARERADDLNKKVFPTHASSAATQLTSITSRSRLRDQRVAMEA